MAKSKKNKSVKTGTLTETENQKKQWMEELKNSEAVQQYLAAFNAMTVQSFIEYYVQEKVYWHMDPERNSQNNEGEQLKWINRAFHHLEVILQKKLFDAQCLWRAEKIMIKEVEICDDFNVWEDNVFNCSFIEPVNEYDIELYSQYLNQNNADAESYQDNEWQDYAEIKEAYETNNANRDFPEWYDFHNGRTGAGTLLSLPDIRGEKERFYCDLHFDNQRMLDKEKEEAAAKNRDDRPFMDYIGNDFIKWFVHTYENKKVQGVYNEYSWANRNQEKKQEMAFDFNDLINADEPVPIEAHYDWYEGLIKAQNSYCCKKIAEALPMALEQYQMNIQMGIAFPVESNGHAQYIRPIWLSNILNGRKLNGEPEDLNF